MQITVTLPDGATHTVEPSALTLPDGAQLLAPGSTPDGFVSKDFHEAEVKRRSKDTATTRRELSADAEFKASVLREYGIPVGDDGRPAIPDVSAAVQTARQKWEEEQLRPVAERLGGLERTLSQKALAAAAKGLVRDEFAAAPVPGAPSYVETILGPRVRFDPELGYDVAYAEDGKTPLPSANPRPGRPYADAAEFVTGFLASDAGAVLRKPDAPPQQGAGYRGGSGTAATGALRRSAMSAEEKAAYVRDHGTDHYLALPE